MGWKRDSEQPFDDPKTYVYAPKWSKTIDYSPDHRPSDSEVWYFDHGEKVGLVLQIKADDGTVLGALVLRGASKVTDPLGKVEHGISSFSIDEIRYS